MTPQQFHDTYRPTADQVSAGTSIDPIALLSQWANETEWGTFWAGKPYNLANIRNGPSGSIVTYPSLASFVDACIWTFKNARPNLNLPVSASNNYYWPVMAATNATDQLNAIVASPWSEGHYGGSLNSFYQQLEGYELTPEQAAEQSHMYQVVGEIYYALGIKGGPSDIAGAPPTNAHSTVLDEIKTEIANIPSGGTPEPPEPPEPTKISLTIDSVPGTATGTIGP